jgi:group I intron endonuclease
MKNKCSIYKITNSINEKVYIGQTWRTINKRFSSHKIKKSGCRKLVNAFNKHDRYNFNIEIIVTCDNQMTADYLETFWINTYDSIKNGYNIKTGGSNGRPSEETKKKISATLTGRKHDKPMSQKTRDKLSAIHTGMKRTEETKKKIKEARKTQIIVAYKRTNESLNKQSISMTGKTWKMEDGKRIWYDKD